MADSVHSILTALVRISIPTVPRIDMLFTKRIGKVSAIWEVLALAVNAQALASMLLEISGGVVEIQHHGRFLGNVSAITAGDRPSARA
jgi:hypothetical protein